MTTNVATLKKEIAELQDRIQRLEADVKMPLEADYSEQAMQLSDRAIRLRLLEIERDNLSRRETELQKLSV